MVRLHPDELRPLESVATHESALRPGSYGASVIFVGTMRDFNLDETVEAMFLEHYPGMTERELERIEDEVRERWNPVDILIAHRTGHVEVGQPIVVLAVWAEHRAPAFEACRSILEQLKQKAPFWKRERLTDGRQRWVEANTTDIRQHPLPGD